MTIPFEFLTSIFANNSPLLINLGYTIEPGISYSVIKGGKLFVSDRYRDAFSEGKGYQTNTIYAGATYDVTDFDTVTAKLYRKYNDTESNGIEVAYTRWF